MARRVVDLAATVLDAPVPPRYVVAVTQPPVDAPAMLPPPPPRRQGEYEAVAAAHGMSRWLGEDAPRLNREFVVFAPANRATLDQNARQHPVFEFAPVLNNLAVATLFAALVHG